MNFKPSLSNFLYTITFGEIAAFLACCLGILTLCVASVMWG